MKKLLLILTLLFITVAPVLSQEDTGDGDDASVRDKMIEYIQQRLDLSKAESAKFSPLFIRYFKEWRKTVKANRGDKLVLRQKIVDLQLRYRPQFRNVVGEQRSNKIFSHQENFIRELKDLQRERRQNHTDRPLLRRNP